ncbi:hypothetical protein DZB84_14315 [Bacillus sp. HNG]|uniref:hypothetical protein n=1 Tax=Bacillus sp. HNG TaxID=2293325 RepID=UPI000E2E8DD8|nr:hypothetical protein [Bacillus sp. HNG]RFB15077.1 hypothetical protein DZB84_14315 [Bacillus sp. HNG]
MKLLKKLSAGVLVAGLAFTFFASNTSAAYLPVEGGMTPQHHSVKAISLTNFKKKLTWYDSDSTRYYVTYRDGNGEYDFRGQAFTSYSTYTLGSNYNLGTRTTLTWTDSFTVSGLYNTFSMNGSIKLTR